MRLKISEESRNEAFRKGLAKVINEYCRENASNTPDFVLAEYLFRCLKAGEGLITKRESWYGRELRPGHPRLY